MDTHSRSFAKALSWRITGTIDTMIISLVVTGSIKLAAAIGVTEVFTKSLLYYFHGPYSLAAGIAVASAVLKPPESGSRPCSGSRSCRTATDRAGWAT